MRWHWEENHRNASARRDMMLFRACINHLMCMPAMHPAHVLRKSCAQKFQLRALATMKSLKTLSFAEFFISLG